MLGGGQAIPGVEELIMELKPGETTERAVRWPDDFPDEAQRGKTKPVRVTLLDVKRKSLPALDDAFAREVGDFDSLDALHATVRKDLEEHATREADAGVRQQLHRPDRRGESVRRSAELGESADRRLHAGVPDPRGGARAVRAASSARSPSGRCVAT